MPEIKTFYRCMHCAGLYDTQKEALACAATHVNPETWVMTRDGGMYRVFPNCKAGSWGSLEWAMKRAKEDEDA